MGRQPVCRCVYFAELSAGGGGPSLRLLGNLILFMRMRAAPHIWPASRQPPVFKNPNSNSRAVASSGFFRFLKRDLLVFDRSDDNAPQIRRLSRSTCPDTSIRGILIVLATHPFPVTRPSTRHLHTRFPRVGGSMYLKFSAGRELSYEFRTNDPKSEIGDEIRPNLLRNR